MDKNNRGTQKQNRGQNYQNGKRSEQGMYQNTNRQRTFSPRYVKKKKKGIRIGGILIRPRFIVAVIMIIIAVVIAVNAKSASPDCYEINQSMITVYEEVQSVLIKSEHGYEYKDGTTLISRIEDGSYVEMGDIVAVMLTEKFNDAWYSTLEIARKNTIDYMVHFMGNEETLINYINVTDVEIKRMIDEMTSVVEYDPEKYKYYSDQIRNLYNEKRNTILEMMGPEENVKEYLTREQEILNNIEANTLYEYAQMSGIISYNTDGYANVYNYKNIDSVKKEVYENIIEGKVSVSIENERKKCDYYISDMNKNYIVMCGNGNTLKYLQMNDETIITINDRKQYMATVVKFEIDGDETFVIIEPSGSLAEYYRDRKIEVKVEKNWKGLVVPKDHIVKKKDQIGVIVYIDGKQQFEPIKVKVQNDTVVVLDTDDSGNIFKAGVQIVKQK